MEHQKKRQTSLSITLTTLDMGKSSDHTALLDSGATGLFIDTKLVEAKGYITRKLEFPIPVYNIDNTANVGRQDTWRGTVGVV